jgi:DNA-binding NarL/FixJ family response regulator
MSAPDTTTCFIVDDVPSFLALASKVLERNGIDVVGTARSAAEALARAPELRPDVVLVDIDLGADSGFELTRDLAMAERLSVILISAHAQAEFTDLIDASPALGFIPKVDLSAPAVQDLLSEARP